MTNLKLENRRGTPPPPPHLATLRYKNLTCDSKRLNDSAGKARFVMQSTALRLRGLDVRGNFHRLYLSS